MLSSKQVYGILFPFTSIQLFLIYFFTHSRHYGDLTTIVPEASWMQSEPNKLTESKLSGNKEENLYEQLPEYTSPQNDTRTQQTSSGTNPLTWESFTEGLPYSIPNADDVQFNFRGDLVDPYEPFPQHH